MRNKCGFVTAAMALILINGCALGPSFDTERVFAKLCKGCTSGPIAA
jgi:hypothetical protein